MPDNPHIPFLESIPVFYKTFRIGTPPNDFFCVNRMEDQPDGKLTHMPLFRGNFFRIAFFTSPGVKYFISEKELQVSSNSIYFGFPGKLESWTRDGHVTGYVVFFRADFIGLDPIKKGFEEQFPFFTHEGESMIQCNDEESARLKRIMERMITELNTEDLDRYELLRHLLNIYLIRLRRIYKRQVELATPEEKTNTVLFHRFRLAMDDYFRELSSGRIAEAPSVSVLADSLNVNASYLNSVIKLRTGKTASSFIQEKTILEAKSYLMHTDLQVSEIAWKLGYANYSYFNRFFRKNAGITPLEFRGSNRL